MLISGSIFNFSGLITTYMDDNYLFFPNRPKEIEKERKYEYLYKEIPVVKDKIYYYQEDWEILFCKEKNCEIKFIKYVFPVPAAP